MDNERREPWLTPRKTSIQWNFWNRYRLYLEDNEGLPPKILNDLDRWTDRILDNLFDPKRSNVVIAKG